ncbi:hypothetical protein D0839_15995 [Bordetella avium]|uniref:hypothetical protein n=1 Tax=Bordetella avium TaxID=521 RepID=UPI000E67AF61|nr:hypothetical protein [Bordetella avium]RIQ15947.1 hypothetical protein D0850_16610 [Bordetella avium]RIQ30185.1 hypothetical protein D0849_16235 [Bordetella avium]RIQ66472.1 hypothetical protein D0839_15995 [Bordetella avium]
MGVAVARSALLLMFVLVLRILALVSFCFGPVSFVLVFFLSASIMIPGGLTVFGLVASFLLVFFTDLSSGLSALGVRSGLCALACLRSLGWGLLIALSGLRILRARNPALSSLLALAFFGFGLAFFCLSAAFLFSGCCVVLITLHDGRGTVGG